MARLWLGEVNPADGTLTLRLSRVRGAAYTEEEHRRRLGDEGGGDGHGAPLPQRFGLTGERRHLRVRNLMLAKDVLISVAGSVGLSVLVLQIVLYRQAPKGAVPLETGVYRQRRRLIGRAGSRGP